jgi:hypothetical protein
MSTTIAELSLSKAYRHAQRALASWLERDPAVARREAFAVRAALGGLDATERSRLARWLAWLSVAARSHGEASAEGRLLRLDVSLHQAVQDALVRLPASMLEVSSRIHRRSA